MHTRNHQALARSLALLAAIALGVAAAPVPSAVAGLVGEVNVNTATLDELQLLPGVGEARAQALMESRKARGGFKKVEDLLEVKGIGETSLARMRPFVRLSGKTTARIE